MEGVHPGVVACGFVKPQTYKPKSDNPHHKFDVNVLTLGLQHIK